LIDWLINRQQRDALKNRLSLLDFTYMPPSPQFNPASVKGPIASLISLAPGDFHKSALEITAGVRFYNAVAEDERVAKEFLVGGAEEAAYGYYAE
jgi:structural maintenance of chromosome 2